MAAQPFIHDLPPPEFLQLAGHPVRWRLLSELSRSDRAVAELTARLAEPQNLVSYHLAKLRDGGLVLARRSEADRRDTYYGLDLGRVDALLSEVARALHPGLRRAAGAAPRSDPPARVLFLCTGNSARSQMAEALLRARSGGAVEAFSAGSHPKPLHPNAARALREDFGLDMTGQESKSVAVFAGRTFDRVITLCDRVREVCPEFRSETGDLAEAVHWSLPNPATGEPDAVTWPLFRRTAAELSARIDFLLASLAEPAREAA